MKKIIAITGSPGSGKSTVMQHLCEHLPQAIPLYEDDFQTMTDLSPEDLAEWWQRGGDVSEFDFCYVEMLLAHFKPDSPFCHHHQPVVHAESMYGTANAGAEHEGRKQVPFLLQLELDEKNYLFLESQFGRYHPQLRHWIDAQIWLDLPPDRCLARKLAEYARFLAKKPFSSNFAENLEWVANYCHSYDQLISRMIAKQKSWVVPHCDVVIASDAPPECVARECLEFILDAADQRIRRPK